MSKSVLLSIKPKYCEFIASGKKTIEVRKTKPKLDTPFKCYIYCTKGELLTRSHYNSKIYVASSPKYQKALERNGNITLSGKVIGEFVCKAILPISITYSDTNSKIALREFPFTCLTDKEIMDYLGNGKIGYGFHISDLVIYDKPRDLSEFRTLCTDFYDGKHCDECEYFIDGRGYEYDESDCGCDGLKPLKRPPQSWCYVEELG